MKKAIALFLTGLIFGASCMPVVAQVSLPKIIGSNMVLQQGLPIPVWGWASKGEKVTVSFQGKSVSGKAGADGKWMIRLQPEKAGGPYEMEIKGRNTIKLTNILVGEVWVCSGQSNMEWTVSKVNDADNEIASAKYPAIRLFTVPKKVSASPEKDIPDGEWEECNPSSIPGFSAVGYFFGRTLLKELNVPIGLIHTSWGGTNIETWTSAQMMSTVPEFRERMNAAGQLDFEKLQKEAEAQETAWYKKIETEDTGLKENWKGMEVNDAGWKSMNLPVLWESAGLGNFDGIVWFRKEIELTAEEAKGDAVLALGSIDDSDYSFINGVGVGSTLNQYNINRVYQVPAGVLKAGKNVIVVRVIDTGGGGGLWGERDRLYLQTSNGKKIPLAGTWRYQETIQGAPVQAQSGPNSFPSLLYNAMLHPLIPFGIRGAIWYQGEANASKAYQYRYLFPNMIRDWRTQWSQGDFPFLFVQLANYMEVKDQPAESEWAELREAQTMTLASPMTGMAVAIDIGEAKDIHPRNKQDVGLRLALEALRVSYGKEIVSAGPLYKDMRVEGNKVRLHFTSIGSGLYCKDKYGYVKGFAIAGADKRFVWARAYIDGNSVVVYSDQVKEPLAVRYAWADNPDDANLYNREGLPASPFRTDSWEGITFGRK
ncbi:MAG: sialate O-acetylesterase [Bacteroidales bacterium]